MFRGQNRNDSDGNLAPTNGLRSNLKASNLQFFSCMGERGGGRGMCTFTTTGLLASHINFRPWYWYREKVKHITPMQPWGLQYNLAMMTWRGSMQNFKGRPQSNIWACSSLVSHHTYKYKPTSYTCKVQCTEMQLVSMFWLACTMQPAPTLTYCCWL